MAIGRKKKKAEVEAASTPLEANTPSEDSRRRKKENETLASVVNESTPGATIDLLKQNPAFELPGKKAWLALMLSTDDIQGLSVKQKSDSAKGSIIELIRADKIQAVVTAEMLAEEYLGIIPNPETLDRMGEYGLLINAPYYWVVFEPADDGSLRLLPVDNIRASHADAVAISTGSKSIEDLLPAVWQHYTSQHGEPEQKPQAKEEPVEEESLPSPVVDDDPMSVALPFDDAPSFEEEGLDYNELDDDEAEPSFDDEEPSFDEQLDEQFGDEDETPEDGSYGDDDDEDAYHAYVDENRSRTVSEDEVRDTIARRFLAEDLDLQVDLADFERTFAAQPITVGIEITEDPSDWLGSQVAQLARQANAELALAREAHIQKLRELFVETMSIHAEHTINELSPDNESSPFYALMQAAKSDYENARSESQRELAEIRKGIQDRFDQAAEARAQQAAAHARAQYEDKNRPKLERDMSDAQFDLERRNEERYNIGKMTVLELRKKEAQARMDLGLTRVFGVLREHQDAQREEERALLRHWNDELIRFIDENRKNDVARAEALAEQLARENIVEVTRQDYAKRIEEMQAEAERRDREANELLVRARQEALDQLNQQRAEWEASLALEQERTNSARELNRELTAQMEVLGREIEGNYKAHIENLTADKQSFAEELERAALIQSRSNKIVIVLILVLTLAALAVGVLLGQWWGVSQSNANAFVLLGSSIFPDALIEPAGLTGS